MFKNGLFIFFIVFSLNSTRAFGGGKIGINFIYMAPYGSASTDFSDPGIGIGFQAVLPVSPIDRICSFTLGAEVVNLRMRSMDFNDYEQKTTQDYFRFIAGFQIGGYGEEFLRPHGGLNIAIVRYSISTDIIYSDNSRESVSEEGKTIVGCDMTFGVDLNFHNQWNLDFGARYVKSFGLIQQLGTGLVKVHPEYFQLYLGAGLSFEYLFNLALHAPEIE